jgi:hypothetical protein
MVTVPLPVDWFPDEIVYSLASRYHRVSGNRSSGQTSRCLFGSGTAGGDAEIPTSLRLLAARAEGALGSAEDMIFTHTVLPAYSPFMTRGGSQEVGEGMQEPIHASRRIRALLNIGSQDVALRACRACMADDRERRGVAYWHRSHQLPCTWACLKHKQPLLTSDVTGRNSWLHRWRLPDEAVLQQLVMRTDALELWLRCARVASRLAALPPDFHFDASRLDATYTSRAWASGAPEKHAVVCQMPLAPHHRRALASAVSGVSTQAAQGFRTQLHIPLIAILFGSWKQFWNAYAAVESGLPSRPRCKRPDEKSHFLSLVKQGNSSSTAARLTGVDVTTGLVWAASANVTSTPRPKILNDANRRHAISLLRLGADKAAVAKEAGVSVVSVTRLLGVVPRLRAEWTHARLTSAIDAAKLRLSRLTEAAPDLSAKNCRSLEPAAYALLYRRDREWLLALLGARPKLAGHTPALRQGATDARSAALLVAAQSSLLRFATSEAHAADILVTLPSLIPVGANLSMMPRTRKAVVGVLRLLETRQLSLL